MSETPKLQWPVHFVFGSLLTMSSSLHATVRASTGSAREYAQTPSSASITVPEKHKVHMGKQSENK